MNPILLLLPIISALIGWLTNWVAIRMLFRPTNPHRILGIKIQGLVPARQKEMARKFGEVIERDFFNPTDIITVLNDWNLAETLQSSSVFLSGIQKMPIIRAPVMALINEIKRSVVKNMERAIAQMNIKEIIRRRIESFEVDYLEDVVLRLSKRELKAIEYLGGVLGFIIGWIQLGIICII